MKLTLNTFKNEPQAQNEHDEAVFLKETVEDSIFVEAAKTYIQAGFSPIPAKKDKKPACNWKCYQSEKMSLDDVDASFRDAEAIAVICGKVSGGLEVIDVDRKADPSGRIVKEILKRIQERAPGLFEKLVSQKTVNGGAHFVYRIEGGEVPKSQKLARLLPVNGEKTPQCLIETRGEGGYILAAPSTGYKLFHKSFEDVPVISKEERDLLISICKSFDQVEKIEAKPLELPSVSQSGERPGEVFNKLPDVADRLLKAFLSEGWEIASKDSEKWQLRRPGKDDGNSCTLYKTGAVNNFSTSTNLETDRAMTPFHVLAQLKYNSDEQRCAVALAVELEMQPKPSGKTQKSKTSSFDVFARLQNSNLATEEKITEMKEKETKATYLVGKLALMGEATVFFAAPSTGKTLLTFKLLSEAVAAGFIDPKKVFYLNCDDNYEGLITKSVVAEKYGFNHVAPGLGEFKVEDFFDLIDQLISTETARGFIVVLDTLKKFQDLMDKKGMRLFTSKVREFVQARGTLLALAHTNKHDINGKSVPEGVGDILNDFDCAYVIEMKTSREEQRRIVMFENRKLRGPVCQRFSYSYNAGESVTWEERFDSVKRIESGQAKKVLVEQDCREAFKKDQSCVQHIEQLIESGKNKRTAIVKAKPEGCSRGEIKRVLDTYDQSNPIPDLRKWVWSKGDKNAKIYSLQTEN